MADSIDFQPLRTLVDAERGISYGVVQPGQHTANGVPIVRVTDVRDGRINASDPLRVHPEIAAKYRRTTLRGGELLLTLVGTVGETAIVPDELEGWNTARAVAVIPVLTDPGPRWVQYALRTGGSREYIDTRLNTTVQATLNLGDVSALPIPMPRRAVRERILDILGTLDDKIELNRRMNDTLEAMARALFKSWFVDFDPVRAKAEGRQPSGMDAETAKLFPSEFAESELGRIPKGWMVGPVGEVLSLEYGKALKADARREGTVAVYGSNGQVGVHDEALRKGPGIVIGRKGNPGMVTWAPTDFFVIDTAFWVAPRGNLGLHYLRAALERMDLTRLGADSAVPGVNRHAIYAQPLLLPPPAPLAVFEDQVGRWYRALASRDNEGRLIGTLRDALLPRLLSGELSVVRAERAVGDVA